MFFTGAGAGFRQNSEHRGRAGAGFSIFFNTGAWAGAGAGPGLTKFTYTGAGVGFVKKYRGLTGARAWAGAPVGSYHSSSSFTPECRLFVNASTATTRSPG